MDQMTHESLSASPQLVNGHSGIAVNHVVCKVRPMLPPTQEEILILVQPDLLRLRCSLPAFLNVWLSSGQRAPSHLVRGDHLPLGIWRRPLGYCVSLGYVFSRSIQPSIYPANNSRALRPPKGVLHDEFTIRNLHYCLCR